MPLVDSIILTFLRRHINVLRLVKAIKHIIELKNFDYITNNCFGQ